MDDGLSLKILVLGSSARSRELYVMMPVGLFHLEILCDSIISTLGFFFTINIEYFNITVFQNITIKYFNG